MYRCLLAVGCLYDFDDFFALSSETSKRIAVTREVHRNSVYFDFYLISFDALFQIIRFPSTHLITQTVKRTLNTQHEVNRFACDVKKLPTEKSVYVSYFTAVFLHFLNFT